MINNNQAVELLLSTLPHIDAEGLTILLKESRNFLQQERSALLLRFVDLIKDTDPLAKLTMVMTEVKNLPNDNLKQECLWDMQRKLMGRINSSSLKGLHNCIQTVKTIDWEWKQLPLNIIDRLLIFVKNSQNLETLYECTQIAKKIAKDLPENLSYANIVELPREIKDKLLNFIKEEHTYDTYDAGMILHIVQCLSTQTNPALLEEIRNLNITGTSAKGQKLMYLIQEHLNLPEPAKDDLTSRLNSAYNTCNNNPNAFKNSLADLNIDESLLNITFYAIKNNEKMPLNMVIKTIYRKIENKQSNTFANMIQNQNGVGGQGMNM